MGRTHSFPYTVRIDEFALPDGSGYWTRIGPRLRWLLCKFRGGAARQDPLTCLRAAFQCVANIQTSTSFAFYRFGLLRSLPAGFSRFVFTIPRRRVKGGVHGYLGRLELPNGRPGVGGRGLRCSGRRR